jgi:hypothetical protein
MSVDHDHDKSFPYFEEHNFSGWLIQFKAMLRELDCDEIIETPSVGVLVSYNSQFCTDSKCRLSQLLLEQTARYSISFELLSQWSVYD